MRTRAVWRFPAVLLSPLAFWLLLLAAWPVRLAAQPLDTGFDPNVTGGFATVFAVAVQPDGKIIIGGSFTNVGSPAAPFPHPHPRNNIARLNVDGSLDTTFNPGTGVDNPVYCVAVQADGKILLGGYFTSVNGQTRSNIARLNADGSVESTTTFNPGTGADNAVNCLAVQADGRIVLGGNFTSVAGTPRKGIARLNTDGSVESQATFNPGSGADDYVFSVAVQTDGKILLGGYFTTMNGAARKGIARLNTNGSVEDIGTFNAGTGANNAVRSIAVQSDGKILLGGNFTSVNLQPKSRIARLNPDGSVEDTVTFNPGAGADFSVYGIAGQVDGKILLSGGFSTVDNQTRIGIARLNSNGTLDTSFSASTDYEVNGVAVQANGRIVLGGPFSMVNNTLRNAVARLANDAATQSVGIANSGLVQWMRSGAVPEVSLVTFELSINGGTTWSILGSGTRIIGGWQLTGLALPSTGSIRARGRTSGGYYGGSSGLVETLATFDGDGLPDTWELAYWPTTAGQAAGDDGDGDGLNNLLEWAFGTNPTVTTSGVISLNGTAIAQRGRPTTWLQNIPNGVDFRALFGRRKDYLSAGLTYTVQFSADLMTWQDSLTTPTVLASDAEMEAVTVPYPFFVDGRKARFFRVHVSTTAL